MTRNLDADLVVVDSTGREQLADSWEEYWIANALVDIDEYFEYQVSVLGGRRLPGGYVLDFVLGIAGLQVIEYAGDYWHEGRHGSGDSLKYAWIRRNFRKLSVLTSADVFDQDSANSTIRMVAT